MRLRLLAPLFILFVAASCARKTAPASAKPPVAPMSAASASPAAAAPAPEATAAATTAPLPYEARMGKVTFSHYCQTCHGETGAGDGFNAFNLDPHPRDLSDPEFQKKKSDADLADAIRRGGAGVGLSALMPPWGHTLSDRQVGEVVLYLRTLPALRKPAS
jgi:cytochrome c oxidase cbb3-type subunit 3